MVPSVSAAVTTSVFWPSTSLTGRFTAMDGCCARFSRRHSSIPLAVTSTCRTPLPPCTTAANVTLSWSTRAWLAGVEITMRKIGEGLDASGGSAATAAGLAGAGGGGGGRRRGGVVVEEHASFVTRGAGAVRDGHDQGVSSLGQLDGDAECDVLAGCAGLLLPGHLGTVERDRDAHGAGATRHLAGQRDALGGHPALVLRLHDAYGQRRRRGLVEGDGLEREAAQVAAVGPHELLDGWRVPEHELDPTRLRRRGEKARLEHLHDAEGLEHARGHAHVLVGAHLPRDADQPLPSLPLPALHPHPAPPPH